MAKDVCIVIAVAEPEGPLDALPGAVPSAKRFAGWARRQGYDVRLVTDEGRAPVTCERLSRAFREALGSGGQNRILVAFLGHGLIRGPSEEYWLLTDWRTRATEAVNHLKLRDRLETYNPKQIGIVSDACRSLPTERAKWVEGNGVVDIKDYLERPVQVAHLSGTRAAQPAFQTPLGVEEQYCFFTQVLTKALQGEPRDVVEMDDGGRPVVLNDRLFAVVERELPRLASTFGRRQIPQLEGSWRSPQPHNVWSILTEEPLQQDGLIGPPAGAEPAGYRSADSDPEAPALARTNNFHARLRSEVQATRLGMTCGLVISGARVRDVVTGPGFEVARDETNPSWFHIEASRPSTSVAVQLEDGQWLAAAVYDGMIGTFSVNEDGAQAYVLSPAWSRSRGAEIAAARAATSAISDPFELAALLRSEKHADPVLGALSAYAYARAGSVEDIRRTCYYYASYNQPAPFDAVLLARARVVREGPGYVAEIPGVPDRDPRNSIERTRPYTYEGTPWSRIAVAGGFPWLRQGWALLEDRREWRDLARFAAGLRPGVFSTFTPKHGRELAELIRRGEL